MILQRILLLVLYLGALASPHLRGSHAEPYSINDFCTGKLPSNYSSLMFDESAETKDPCEDFYGFVCSRWIAVASQVDTESMGQDSKAVLSDETCEGTSDQPSTNFPLALDGINYHDLVPRVKYAAEEQIAMYHSDSIPMYFQFFPNYDDAREKILLTWMMTRHLGSKDDMDCYQKTILRVVDSSIVHEVAGFVVAINNLRRPLVSRTISWNHFANLTQDFDWDLYWETRNIPSLSRMVNGIPAIFDMEIQVYESDDAIAKMFNLWSKTPAPILQAYERVMDESHRNDAGCVHESGLYATLKQYSKLQEEYTLPFLQFVHTLDDSDMTFRLKAVLWRLFRCEEVLAAEYSALCMAVVKITVEFSQPRWMKMERDEDTQQYTSTSFLNILNAFNASVDNLDVDKLAIAKKKLMHAQFALLEVDSEVDHTIALGLIEIDKFRWQSRLSIDHNRHVIRFPFKKLARYFSMYPRTPWSARLDVYEKLFVSIARAMLIHLQRIDTSAMNQMSLYDCLCVHYKEEFCYRVFRDVLDVFAVDIAAEAYKAWFNYNDDMSNFFRSFAGGACRYGDASAGVRVNAALRNSKIFRDTFKCGKPCGMNPETRCSLSGKEADRS